MSQSENELGLKYLILMIVFYCETLKQILIYSDNLGVVRVIFGRTILLVLFLFFNHFAHAQSLSGITYHGKILRADDSPLDSPTAVFKIEIRSPGIENCLLWREEQAQNMSTSNGIFVLNITDTSSSGYSRTDGYAWNRDRVFSNRTNFTGLTDCASGTTYNPGSTDGRLIRVSFKESAVDPTWEDVPIAKINFVPMSLNSQQLAGFGATEFLKIDSGASQTPLSIAEVNTLLQIIAGTSTVYIKPGDTVAGDLSGTFSAPVVDGIQGVGVAATAPTLNQILKYNGTSWAPANEGTPGDASYAAKGVVQFLTDQATSGIQVAAGVASLPNTITAGGPTGNAQTIPVITYDAKGRLTTVTTATVDDNTKLPLAGGTMTGALDMGNQNINNANTISATGIGTRTHTIYDADNSNYATLQVPSVLAANYSLTLPADDGTAGQVLSTDGNGVLSWIANGSGATGDILNGGNTTGAAVTIGTNDNFALNFETNGSNKMTILANGDVNIGTAPTSTINFSVGPNSYSDNNGFAIGVNSYAGFRAVSLGTDSGAMSDSVAAGRGSWAANGGVAIGSDSNAEGDGGVSIGPSTYSSAYGSVAIGEDSYSLKKGISIGSDANTGSFGLPNGTFNLAIGNMVIANAINGFAIGTGVDSVNRLSNTTNNSLAIGFNSNLPTLFVGPSSGVGTVGNVGIGTTSPATAIDINGAQTFREMAAPALSPADQGRIYFDSTANKFKVSENGGAYVDLVSAVVSSSGTAGHLQFSDGSGGFNSDSNQLFWDSTNNRLGIGTNTPSMSLQVVGGDATINSVRVGLGGGNIATNTALGSNALASNVDGYRNVAIGTNALATGTSAAAFFMENVAVGYYALPSATSVHNTAIGAFAMEDMSTGSHNTALGALAFANATGESASVAVGYAAANSGGAEVTAIGMDSLSLSFGTRNTGLGYSSGENNTSGTHNTFIGYRARSNAGNYNNSTALGANSIITASNQIVYGDSGIANHQFTSGNVGIGTTTPAAKLDVDGTLRTRTTDVTGVTTVDWLNGNIQYTNDSCQPYNFNNLLDGASYTFVVKGATSAQCTFTAAGLTFRFTPANAVTNANSHTVYSFFRVGADVYVSWTTGL